MSLKQPTHAGEGVVELQPVRHSDMGKPGQHAVSCAQVVLQLVLGAPPEPVAPPLPVDEHAPDVHIAVNWQVPADDVHEPLALVPLKLAVQLVSLDEKLSEPPLTVP